jgi:hypothetical protein
VVEAACHIHSEWSYDARWPLERLAREFRERGYRVLMVTEHDRGFNESRRLQHRRACAEATSEQMLVVPGIEYSDADNVVHVLVWGPVPFLGEGLPTLELLKRVKEADGIAVLAHPSRREAWRRFDAGWIPYLLGLEVWNRKADGWAPSERALELMTDTSLLSFVCFDFHAPNQLFPMSMELDLESSPTEQSVVECLRARRCHAKVFSRPLEQVLRGWTRYALEPAEGIRRAGASTYRWLKNFRAN